MATVRFSQELREQISKIAKEKMAPALTRARESRPDNQWGQSIYDTLFLEVRPYIDRLPAHWFCMTKDVTIERVGDIECGLEFKFATPMRWPQQFPDTALAKQANMYYNSRIVLKHDPAWSDFHAEVVAYRDRVKAAVDRQNEFVKMVNTVTETYSTLAPALKAWPALWELVPDNVKDKHRQIVTKEKREVELNVDLNKLTAMSAAAKFGV